MKQQAFTLIELLVVVAINKAPETRGGILELQLGYRPGSTIQEQS